MIKPYELKFRLTSCNGEPKFKDPKSKDFFLNYVTLAINRKYNKILKIKKIFELFLWLFTIISLKVGQSSTPHLKK